MNFIDGHGYKIASHLIPTIITFVIVNLRRYTACIYACIITGKIVSVAVINSFGNYHEIEHLVILMIFDDNDKRGLTLT